MDTNANRCFVCGPSNEIGLKVRFRLDGDEICRAEWTSDERYVGYDGVTHGGILFCLLDDVMANLLFLKGEPCFTARADVRFRTPLGIGERIELESKLIKRRNNVAVIEAQAIRDSDETVIATARGHFVVSESE